MSDATSGAIRDARRNWVVEHREIYLRSAGRRRPHYGHHGCRRTPILDALSDQVQGPQ